MKILLTPIDTLFFRDGKPFTMGAETWADGNYLPNPSVIYGALKSVYYSNNMNVFQNVSPDNDPASQEIDILGLYFTHKNKIYFPLPLDLIYEKNKRKSEKRKEERTNAFTVSLISKQIEENLSSAKGFRLFVAENEVESIHDGIIAENDLYNYLLGYEDNFKAKKLSKIITSEPKVGISRDNSTHSTSEGKLYRVGMNRYTDFSFAIELAGNLNLDNVGIKLGGEARIAAIKIANEETVIENIKNMNIENKFKLYLSTPAIFEKGWIPKWINENTLIGEINGIKLKLTSAFLGKPIFIGGFDMAKNEPKPMKKAIPAGSVYYFDILEGTQEQIFNTFNKKSISELNSGKQGHGITYIGVLK